MNISQPTTTPESAKSHKTTAIPVSLPYPNFTRRMIIVLGSLLLLLLVAIICGISFGSTYIPFSNTLSVLLSKIGIGNAAGVPPKDFLIIESIRMPRVLVGALVGAALAISGCVMQSLFRNPLADPGIIGVSSGGALGAVLAIAWGWTAFNILTLPVCAFTGAMLAGVAVYSIAYFADRNNITLLLLSGIAISTLLGAIMSTIITNTRNDSELRGIVFWLQGGLESRSWEHVLIALVPVVPGALVISFFGRECNLLLLGDENARSMGVNTGRTRLLLLALSSLITGCAVAVSGVIGFVGLVVPHIMRMIVGPDHRLLLAASALAGSSYLVFCDLISRVAFQPNELRVGVFTSYVGAPFFLFLIIRSRKTGGRML